MEVKEWADSLESFNKSISTWEVQKICTNGKLLWLSVTALAPEDKYKTYPSGYDPMSINSTCAFLLLKKCKGNQSTWRWWKMFVVIFSICLCLMENSKLLQLIIFKWAQRKRYPSSVSIWWPETKALSSSWTLGPRVCSISVSVAACSISLTLNNTFGET